MKVSQALAATVFACAWLAAVAAGKHSGGHAPDEIGQAGVAAQASRTVRVEMTDAMRFSPASVSVRQGETVRFVVRNVGQLRHEMVLGTEQALRENNEAMAKFPEMEHAEANMVTVAPGQSGEIVWRFTRAGTIAFACLQPGHFGAGMKGAVRVAAVKGSSNNAGDRGTHKH